LKRPTLRYDDDRKMDPALEVILQEMRKMQAGTTDLQMKWEEMQPPAAPVGLVSLLEMSKGDSSMSKVYADQGSTIHGPLLGSKWMASATASTS